MIDKDTVKTQDPAKNKTWNRIHKMGKNRRLRLGCHQKFDRKRSSYALFNIRKINIIIGTPAVDSGKNSVFRRCQKVIKPGRHGNNKGNSNHSWDEETPKKVIFLFNSKVWHYFKNDK